MNDSSHDPLPDPSYSPTVEAAVLRRLLTHLATRTDVQNIELMTLAGFCRNCLAKWYAEEAGKLGQTLSVDAAKIQVYGMPYNEWKAKFQREMP